MAGPYTLAQIATRLGGRLVGDGSVEIEQVGSLEHAGARQIAFLASSRYKARLAGTRAAAVVLAPEAESLTALPRIVSEQPYPYFARLSQLLNPSSAPVPGVDAAAQVSPDARIAPSARVEAGAVVGADAQIGERAWIGAGCFVGAGAAIGEDSRLHPSVVVYAGCRIGARAIVHSGAVIGADGFGMAAAEGRWIKVPQIGRVLIGDDVEIGANTTIDRGTVDDTVLEDTAMAGCAGVAGSAVIGRRCTVGGAAVVLGHLSLCDDVHVSAATVISRSIRKPGTYTGMYPFDENAAWARNTALVRHLAELAERLGALEKRRTRRKKRNV
jgi:UDP-3-O-[3-hydroxymyristoyl] glucosamine N-acyltransferase